MATTLLLQGGEIDLDENFDKVKQRINQAITGTDRNGNKATDKARARPLHTLSFKTEDGGRVAINPEKVIGVVSDLPKDTARADDDDDDE